MLFSACHFAAFLDHVCSRFAFNFIGTARLSNPAAADLKAHLANLLQKINTREKMRSAIPLVASSLLLDNYPPDMHREYSVGPQQEVRVLTVLQISDPDVFDCLYRDACY